jgi:hypothetical protein
MGIYKIIFVGREKIHREQESCMKQSQCWFFFNTTSAKIWSACKNSTREDAFCLDIRKTVILEEVGIIGHVMTHVYG